jgi:hypothetical protein
MKVLDNGYNIRKKKQFLYFKKLNAFKFNQISKKISLDFHKLS